jgi:hypothetical protein
MFRWLASAAPVVTASAAAADDTVAPDGFRRRGRSGATKVKVIVVGCAVPDAPPPGLGAQIRDAAGGAKPPRGFAEQWSGDWLNRKPRTRDEWLRQVPPKYRPMVKEYFENLERMRDEKK